MPLYLFLRAIRTISITVKTQEGLIVNEPGHINCDIPFFAICFSSSIHSPFWCLYSFWYFLFWLSLGVEQILFSKCSIWENAWSQLQHSNSRFDIFSFLLSPVIDCFQVSTSSLNSCLISKDGVHDLGGVGSVDDSSEFPLGDGCHPDRWAKVAWMLPESACAISDIALAICPNIKSLPVLYRAQNIHSMVISMGDCKLM